MGPCGAEIGPSPNCPAPDSVQDILNLLVFRMGLDLAFSGGWRKGEELSVNPQAADLV